MPKGAQGGGRGAARPAFSIVVVARNEARSLPHLLSSLWPFRERRGDLLVVDTGSQDETTELARDFGCRVVAAGDRFASSLTQAQAEKIVRRFSRGGEGPLATPGQRLFHFSRARNWAAAQAKHNLVWHLDGSDVVEALDFELVDGSIRRGEAGRVAYEMRLGELSFRTCRFSDRRFDRWEGRAHEGLFPRPDANESARAPFLECPPDRLAVRHVRRGQKERNYLAGLALDVLTHNGRARWLHYLGREFHYLGFHRSAIEALEAHAAREDAWRPERSSSLCLAGQSRLFLGDPAAAAAFFERAHAVDSTWREPLLRIADICAGRGDDEAVVARATAALAIPRTTWHVEADQNYTWAPHFHIYRALLRLGRREEARAHWRFCVLFAPDLPAFKEDAPAFER